MARITKAYLYNVGNEELLKLVKTAVAKSTAPDSVKAQLNLIDRKIDRMRGQIAAFQEERQLLLDRLNETKEKTA